MEQARRIVHLSLLAILVGLLSGCGQTIGLESYPTYVFTHSEIVLFSYANGTSLQITDAEGQRVWRGRLDKGEHHVLQTDPGVYHVVGTHPYATLVGDPTAGAVMGYYALDEYGRGASQLLYTYQSEGTGDLFGLMDNARNFVVFAYQDDTHVSILETDTGNAVWEGTLDAGEAHFEPGLQHVFLTVEADYPVSALSYGDQGYYVPAEDGRFVGTRFYTWAGNAGSWVHDLNVISYQDDTSVRIYNTETDNLLWEGVLDAGQMQVVSDINTQLLCVEASGIVAVSVSPTTSYDSRYAHMVFAQDETGVGIGQQFYYPAIAGARLEIFSYADGAQIEVLNSDGSPAYGGTLNQGESAAIDSVKTLYTIRSTQPIAALMDWGNEAGADFAPPYYVASMAIMPVIMLPRWLPFVLAGVPLGLLAVWVARQLIQPRRRASSGPPPLRSGLSGTSRPVQPDDPKKPPADITHGRTKKS